MMEALVDVILDLGDVMFRYLPACVALILCISNSIFVGYTITN